MTAIVIWLAVLTLVVILWLIGLQCRAENVSSRLYELVTDKELGNVVARHTRVFSKEIEALKRHLDVNTVPIHDPCNGHLVRHAAVPISRCSKCKQEVKD